MNIDTIRVFYVNDTDMSTCTMLLSLIENNELTGSIPPELENLEELDSLVVGESNQTCSCIY